MTKIIEYKVVFDMTLAPFMRLVNEAIADGWQPNGGFTCDRSRYYQAMVKYEPTDEERLWANVKKAAQSRHSAKPGNHVEGV